MEENLKRKTTKALVWSTADKLGQQLFYLVAGIILARQLSPEDYGKVGVLTIFIALSGILIDSGFSSALIRKKEATQADYSTVFYVNVAISCVLYGLLYAAAPYIAVFFKVPDLIYICRILFLVIPLNALSLIQQTLLLKHFKLSVSARVNLWSLGIASVVAIAMAYGGMGVWSLVAQTKVVTIQNSHRKLPKAHLPVLLGRTPAVQTPNPAPGHSHKPSSGLLR